jgi:hypothetical protein
MVYDSPIAVCKEHKECTPSNALYGQHDAHWLIHYLFYRVEMGLVAETELVANLIKLTKHVNWMWFGDTTTIVTRKPKAIHTTVVKIRDDSGSYEKGYKETKVLHNPYGLALEYTDGNGVYSLYGTRIPTEFTWLITKNSPKGASYTIKEVLSIENADIRTLGLRLLGPEALIKEGRKINMYKSKIGGSYTLYELEINGNKRKYLHGICPSKSQPFCEGVPPETTTCKQALAWRESKIDISKIVDSMYEEPLIRT